MRKIKLEKLTKEAFAPFGSYYDMANPDGYGLSGAIHTFYPDRLTAYFGGQVAFSPIVVKNPVEYKITQAEYHTTTAEIILPISGDMIIHVAPPSAGAYVPEYTKAFLVPKNTLVKLNACVWHLAPLPATDDSLTAIIVLPESTYMNDCKVVDLTEDQQFIIEK